MSQISAAVFRLKNRYRPKNRRTRVELAAVYRLVALYGWDDLVFTHISARIPNTENEFLINPYGFLFEEITASSLVKIDLSGAKLLDSPHPVNPAGIYDSRRDSRSAARCRLCSARSFAARCRRFSAERRTFAAVAAVNSAAFKFGISRLRRALR